MEDAKDYYKRHGPMTTAGPFHSELQVFPKSVADLCRVIQGNLIHRELAAWLYDLKLSPEETDAANIRPFTDMLAKVRELDARPLTTAREPNHRMPCMCRHFSTMLCAILREQEIPARAQCGFAAYFTPGKFEDHWVCEYWNAAQERWILVDAQLDGPQTKAFKPDFNPLDVPRADRIAIPRLAYRMNRAQKDLFEGRSGNLNSLLSGENSLFAGLGNFVENLFNSPRF